MPRPYHDLQKRCTFAGGGGGGVCEKHNSQKKGDCKVGEAAHPPLHTSPSSSLVSAAGMLGQQEGWRRNS